MLASTLILLSLLGGKPSATGCIDRCTFDMNRCSGPCGQNQSCMDRCNKQSQRCTTGCVTVDENARQKTDDRNRKLPCGINEQTGAVTPCTEKEQREMKDTVKKTKGVCTDEEGLPIACPGDMEKLKAKMKKMGVDLDCTDSKGVPVECPAK